MEKPTKSQYKEIVIPKGSEFKNARIETSPSSLNFGEITGVSFSDTKQSEFDTGIRRAKVGEFDVIDAFPLVGKNPISPVKKINGFDVSHGTNVTIRLTKDVKNSIPTELIIATATTSTPTDNTNPSIFTTKNIVIGILVIAGIYGLLKINNFKLIK